MVETDHVPPVLPSGLSQFYLPAVVPARAAVPSELVYQPRLLGFAEIVFADKRRGFEQRRPYRLLAEPPAPGQVVSWDTAEPRPRWHRRPAGRRRGLGQGARVVERRQEAESPRTRVRGFPLRHRPLSAALQSRP